MKKFAYNHPIGEAIGEFTFARRLSDGCPFIATRTSEGVVLHSGYDFYKQLSYSEETNQAMATEVTRSETVQRLESALQSAEWASEDRTYDVDSYEAEREHLDSN